MGSAHAWPLAEDAKSSTPVVRKAASACRSSCSLLFDFPSQYRLTHPRQYRKVLGHALYHHQSGPLRILANPNTMPGARLGLIVGKRAVQKAHERNRLKRVARETFRLKRSELPAVDIVVQVRGPIDDDRERGITPTGTDKPTLTPIEALLRIALPLLAPV